MLVADVLRELASRFSSSETERVEVDDIERWIRSTGLSGRALFDEVGAQLAMGFESGLFTFEFCDWTVNELVAYVYQSILGSDLVEWKPDLFWDVYLAFDEGEYFRKPDENPIDAYTRPLISEIVAKLRTKNSK